MKYHHLTALFDSGLKSHANGDLIAAPGYYDGALNVSPRDSDALLSLGLIALLRGDADVACEHIKRAFLIKPNNPAFHYNVGVVLREVGRLEEACSFLKCATLLDPANYHYHYNLGFVLEALGRDHEAATSYREAIRINPAAGDAHCNLSLVLRKLGYIEQAVFHSEIAVATAPENATFQSNLGVVLRQAGRIDQAISTLKYAVELAPDAQLFQFNLGVAYLARGDFVQGWAALHNRKYENPWNLPLANALTPKSASILITGEDGFGDDIQFSRLVLNFVKDYENVRWLVKPELVRLFKASFVGIDIETDICEASDGAEFIVPIMSVPALVNLTLETIPSSPYIVLPLESRKWSLRIPDSYLLRVGVVWRGREDREIDQRRSISVEAIRPLFSTKGVDWTSLHVGYESDLIALKRDGFQLRSLAERVSDFADTAAIIEQLDLIISVDTAVAHLASAMGKPVWLLNRFDSCWRWMIDRQDSPWYPSMRIFRQHIPGDWSGVIERVKSELTVLATAKRHY